MSAWLVCVALESIHRAVIVGGENLHHRLYAS